MLSIRVVSGLAVRAARAKLVRAATTSQLSSRRLVDFGGGGRRRRKGEIKPQVPIRSVCSGPTFSVTLPFLKRVALIRQA